MSEERNDGGTAFPQHPSTGNLEDWRFGMSLRDYFAAKALPEAIRHHLDVRASTIAPGNFEWDLVAVTAFKMADAMLKARGH